MRVGFELKSGEARGISDVHMEKDRELVKVLGRQLRERASQEQGQLPDDMEVALARLRRAEWESNKREESALEAAEVGD